MWPILQTLILITILYTYNAKTDNTIHKFRLAWSLPLINMLKLPEFAPTFHIFLIPGFPGHVGTMSLQHTTL